MEVNDGNETGDKDVVTISDVNIGNLPSKYVWMKIKPGTKVENVIRYAKNAIDSGETRALLWTGYANGVVKTISCVETLKRDYTFHQITKLCQIQIDLQKRTQDEPEITAKKMVPCINILQSLDETVECNENQSMETENTSNDKMEVKIKNKKKRFNELLAKKALKKKFKKKKMK